MASVSLLYSNNINSRALQPEPAASNWSARFRFPVCVTAPNIIRKQLIGIPRASSLPTLFFQSCPATRHLRARTLTRANLEACVCDLVQLGLGKIAIVRSDPPGLFIGPSLQVVQRRSTWAMSSI